MKSEKILYAIYLLLSSCPEKEIELSDLYKKVLDDNKDYKELFKLTQNVIPYGVDGKSILENATHLLESARNNPNEIYYIMDQIRYLLRVIKHNIEQSEAMLRVNDNQKNITIIKKDEMMLFDEVIDSIAKSMMYIIVISGRYDKLHGLVWHKDNISLKMHSVNNELKSIVLQDCRDLYAWVIKKIRNNNEIKLSEYEYVLYKISFQDYFELIKNPEFEKINTNLYYNKTVDEKGMVEIPIYLGIGHIISKSVEDIIDFLEPDRVGYSLNSVKDVIVKEKNITIDDLIKLLCDEKKYVINPIEVVRAFNEWIMARNIFNCTRDKKCIFCGKSMTDGNRVCLNHFHFQR